MKKRVYMVLYVLAVPTFLHTSQSDVIDDTLAKGSEQIALSSSAYTPIDRTTHLVFRRFYFIARLEKTIKLLEEINNTAHKKLLKLICHIRPHSPFMHRTIQLATQRMRAVGTLRPILAVWDDFSCYKSLESDLVVDKDGLFVKEFTQQLFFITKNILSILLCEQQTLKNYEILSIETLSPEALIEVLDDMVDTIEHPYNTIHKNKPMGDIQVHATSDEIQLRFYHINRLESTIEALRQIKQHDPALFATALYKAEQIRTSLQPSDISNNTYHIQNIDHVITKDTLFDEWNNFRQYRHITEKSFAKDFFMLTFSVAKEIYLRKNSEESHSLESILQNTEPEDILYAIDLIADELQATIQAYQKEQIPLSEWLCKRWWIPLIALSTLSLKLAHHLLKK